MNVQKKRTQKKIQKKESRKKVEWKKPIGTQNTKKGKWPQPKKKEIIKLNILEP